MPDNRRTELIAPWTENNREICFEQNKSCVYEPEDEPGTIVSEWPNGVVHGWRVETEAQTRQRLDSTTDTPPARRPPGFPEEPRTTEPNQERGAPKLIIVIGANGAGKTTWCRRHGDQLPEHFYNADAIADGLGDWNSPANQRAARKLVDDRIERHLARNENFGFESTYSGRSGPAIVERARALGYRTTAILIGTQRPEINIQRVAARVATRTGHDVPRSEVRRRWTGCPENVVRTAQAIETPSRCSTTAAPQRAPSSGSITVRKQRERQSRPSGRRS